MRLRILSTCFVTVVMLLPLCARASTIRVTPHEQTIGAAEFQLAVEIDSPRKVNAYDVELVLPRNLEFVRASDGDSIVNFWIHKPSFDPATRRVAFSGITANGYAGTGGRLVVVTVRGIAAGPADMNIATATVLFNSATPSYDHVDTIPAHITVAFSKDAVSNHVPDFDPPENFTPIVATTSTAYVLYFATQDKGSGVARYEFAGSDVRIRDYSDVHWNVIESPYQLSSSDASRYVYIKAVDNDGNERVVEVPPQVIHGRIGAGSDILMYALIIFVLLTAWHIYTNRHTR